MIKLSEKIGADATKVRVSPWLAKVNLSAHLQTSWRPGIPCSMVGLRYNILRSAKQFNFFKHCTG